MRNRALIFVTQYQKELGQIRNFTQRSYSQWAVDEIRRLIFKADKDQSITKLVWDFARMADDLSVSNSKQRLMWSVAYDVAVDILDHLTVSDYM